MSAPSLTQLGAPAGSLLKARGETVAVSESSSAGLVSAALLSVSGASRYFLGGGVIYTQVAREVLLEIDFDNHPGVRSASEAYAVLAARAVRDKLGADWGVSETGAAGPTGNRYGDDAGHTCIAIVGPGRDGIEHVVTLETGDADREGNMWRFAEHTLDTFVAALEKA
jgi:PncC family amidohydrolase